MAKFISTLAAIVLDLAFTHQHSLKWEPTTETGEKTPSDIAGERTEVKTRVGPSGARMVHRIVTGTRATINGGAQIIMMSALTYSPALLVVR